MPLYIGDYLADTSHLSASEHGAYLLLIMHYWRTAVPLPDADGVLIRIARMSKSEWKASRAVLRAFFHETIINGARVLTHTRIEREMIEAKTRYERRSNAGGKGAAKRWQKNSNAIPELMANTCQPQPQPQPQSSNEDKSSLRSDSVTRAPKRARSKDALNGHAREFDEFWLAYPKRVAKGAAVKAYVKALTRADPAVILDGARAYARSRRDEDSQFTKAPATWLNADCWLDETPLSEGLSPDPKLKAMQEAEAAFRKERGYE